MLAGKSLIQGEGNGTAFPAVKQQLVQHSKYLIVLKQHTDV
jgi:hypothetical protein